MAKKSGYTQDGVPNYRARRLLRSLLDPNRILFKMDVESRPVGAIWVNLVLDGYAALDGATGDEGYHKSGRAIFSLTEKGRKAANTCSIAERDA